MEELWGLPAHPFFVHIPVVLLPILGSVALMMVARPKWRRRRPLLFVGTTLVTTVATILAARSGEPFKEALQPGLGSRIDRHADLGDQTALLATLFFVAVAAMAAGDRWISGRKRTVTALSMVAGVLGALAAIWVIRTGHEGARVTWSGVDVSER